METLPTRLCRWSSGHTQSTAVIDSYYNRMVEKQSAPSTSVKPVGTHLNTVDVEGPKSNWSHDSTRKSELSPLSTFQPLTFSEVWTRKSGLLHLLPYNFFQIPRSKLRNQNQTQNRKSGIRPLPDNNRKILFSRTLIPKNLESGNRKAQPFSNDPLWGFLWWPMPDFFTWSFNSMNELDRKTRADRSSYSNVKITLSRSQKLLASSDCRSPINRKLENQKS